MTISAQHIASGPGWRAEDVVCTAGPGDAAFEEAHANFSVAAVTDGLFRYRGSDGEAVLARGALLLGNAGASFQCRHDHSRGDRCVAFHFSGDFLERVASAIPGLRRVSFNTPRLTPQPVLERLFAEAEIARDEQEHGETQGIALRFAGAALTLTAGETQPKPPTGADERRAAAAQQLIDADPARPVDLEMMAAEANTSPFHFLRVFRQVVGQTPHQYVLQARLRRAAVRLRRSDDQIIMIALDAGFNDLSTFNRRFKRVMGETPGQFRARVGAAA